MSIKKLSFMLLSALSLAALLNGCGSSSKEGTSPGDVAKVSETTCRVCHAVSTDPLTGNSILKEFLASPHNTDAAGCQGCHGGGAQHNGIGPIPFPNPVDRCIVCHDGSNAFGNDSDIKAQHTGTYFVTALGGTLNCGTCHNPHDPINAPFAGGSCVVCHSLPQDRTDKGTYVGPAGGASGNNGVRTITGEFGKWSHHVTGVTLNDAHCAACHLEGKAVNGKIVVDTTKHMADAKIHLRNADNDVDMQWDPAAPNFSSMDNFCLSCHDADGATSAGGKAIQAFINSKGLAASGKTASASNPFGDTISNQYDKLQRPAVVDAAGQFATGNNSHHAVLGKKYSGRTRVAGSRQIADAATFASNSGNSVALGKLPGTRSTIYDAGKFTATYITLADASGENGTRNGGTSLGDDSTLHCGDCHTVGQFRAADAAPGNRYNKAVIGAHGANNEYLLRNNLGTDEKHTGAKFAGSTAFGADVGLDNMPYLVCFNCHTFQTYGSAYGTSGGGHAAEYDVEGRCNGAGQTINSVFGNMTGEGRLRTFNTDATNYGKPNGDTFGNIFGIECNNCHNSGVGGNMFGGIHGSKVQTYTDGAGNTSKHRRFLPGLGNSMFAPGTLGGFTGGSLATYNNYSGNRNGTNPAIVPPATSVPAANIRTVGQTFTLLPVREIRVSGVDNGNGSYQYVTGGVSNDLNWEQKSQQPIGGQTILSAKAMGCYTLTPNGTPKINNTVAKGYPADDIRYAATEGQKGPDGRELFDVWGGCDDHNGAQGAGTGFTRKVLRKTTY